MSEDVASLRVVIVDDERPARTKLRRYLADEPGVTVVGEADGGRAAIELIRRLLPDLIFLDVQMPDMDGFAVVEALGADAPAVVFVTAHDDFAMRAFDVHAMSYLLKPVGPSRFRETFARIRSRLEHPGRDAAVMSNGASADVSESATFVERLLLPDGDRSVFVRVDSIDRIEAERNYVVFRTGDSVYRLRATIESVAARLDPSRFLRANRSTVVRLDAVAEAHPWFHGELRLRMSDGTDVTWTKTYIDRAPASLLRLGR